MTVSRGGKKKNLPVLARCKIHAICIFLRQAEREIDLLLVHRAEEGVAGVRCQKGAASVFSGSEAIES